ncbi:hypothetical protein ONA92_02290 [Mycobacteroides salmoniphilum]|uniref:hypothetical protein n=1 Tax=Mycobacteroides salmoniphilum TaxID=404941 RepID=UPI0035628864
MSDDDDDGADIDWDIQLADWVALHSSRRWSRDLKRVVAGLIRDEYVQVNALTGP